MQVGSFGAFFLSWVVLVTLVLVACGQEPTPTSTGPASAPTAPNLDRFPAEQWDRAPSPEAVGWSPEKLREARDYSYFINTAAIIIVHDGLIVDAWGEVSRPFKIHSVRKSILSALYGIHVADGTIDLSMTLADLGIDDNEPSLTWEEKQATIRDLLKARSGIYHPAIGLEYPQPERGSHAPGTFWYYNNWDFNALGTIFEQEVGRSLYEEFHDRIGKPLQMQDFNLERDTRYYRGPASVHPLYGFQLSARDLARFGLLFARGGQWEGRQIIPEAWVQESTAPHSDTSQFGYNGYYGYMWWVAANGEIIGSTASVPVGSFAAIGVGGQYLLVIPEWDIVIVHRVNTFEQADEDSGLQFVPLIRMILEARPAA